MNKLVFIFGLTLSVAQANAGSCTNEMLKHGCHNESISCDRPTHYTCQTCMCPTRNHITTELLDYLTDQTNDSSDLVSTVNSPSEQ